MLVFPALRGAQGRPKLGFSSPAPSSHSWICHPQLRQRSQDEIEESSPRQKEQVLHIEALGVNYDGPNLLPYAHPACGIQKRETAQN